MKTTFALIALLCGSGVLPARTPRNYAVDLQNRYATVGALLIVVTETNPFLPVGLAAFCSGVLIDDVVFLTAGHCVGPSLPDLPPFIKAYVSFSPNALDRSSWIPVVTQAAHPSLPPCPPPAGCDPSSTSIFKAGDPAVTDLGLVFLARTAGIKPAKLASPEQLEKEKTVGIPMTTVGYGHPVPDPKFLALWDGLRKYRSSKLETVLNSVWATWQLPSSVCYGDSGAPTFFDKLPGVFRNRETIVAIASDGGADCASKDIRVRVDSHAVRQWIRQTIREKLGPHVGIQIENE
jgi:V8-like Glu-specific endopeptidase